MFAGIRYTSTDCSLPCDTSTRGRQPRRRPGTRHGHHRLSTSPGSRGARAAGDRWAWSAGGRVGTVAASSSPWVTDETLLPTWLSWKGNSAEEQTLPSRQLGCIPSEGFRGDSSFRCKHPEIPARPGSGRRLSKTLSELRHGGRCPLNFCVCPAKRSGGHDMESLISQSSGKNLSSRPWNRKVSRRDTNHLAAAKHCRKATARSCAQRGQKTLTTC